VGGILVNTQIHGDNCRVLIGCGVNVGPCQSLHSINDLLGDQKLSLEEILAEFCNRFEELHQTSYIRVEEVIKRYLCLWLHSEQKVNIQGEDKDAIIKSIDRFGYLIAESSGTIIKLQPDGNSFDMFQNLIRLKHP
jgi:biotin-(acetyl-CoA carboxylase) ligase